MIREKSKIRVVVTYTDCCLEKIEVDSRQLEDIDAIRNKPISEWFLPSNDRFGWKGLLQEINNFLTDEDVSLYFDFNGSEEVRQIFKDYLAKNGIDPNACLTKEEIINDAIVKAERAHANGLIKDELHHYLVAADEADSPKAQYEVAKIYLSIHKGQEIVAGISCDDALKYACKYYRDAAKQNLTEAQWELYQLLKYDESYYELPNEDAIQWLSKAADAGHLKAIYEKGLYLYKKHEWDTAIIWFEKALNSNANQINFMELNCLLGKCYSNINQEDEAQKHYLTAAYGGYAEAQYCLGKLLFSNYEDEFIEYETITKELECEIQSEFADSEVSEEDVEKIMKEVNKKLADEKEAFDWYLKAAGQNHSKAQYELGFCYEYGFGVEKDSETAFTWYYKAAEQGLSEAQFEVGNCYKSGYGIDQSDKDAFAWFYNAAKQGHIEAQHKVGECYSAGEGIEQSYEKAFDWLYKAAKQGFVDSQHWIGAFYKDGIGVEPNDKESFCWFSQAAKQNHPYSILELGYCYYLGRGTEKNIAVAIDVFNEATKHEEIIAEAQNGLGNCYFHGYNDVSKAFEYYLEAANKNNVDAMVNAGKCFENSYGTPISLIDAKKWYQKAMEQGSLEGKNNYIALVEKYARALCHAKIDRFYIAGEIPEKLLKSATTYQRRKKNFETIVFLLDETMLKTGRDGFILTPSSIIQHFVNTEIYNIHQIKQVESQKSKKGTKLYLLFENESMQELYLGGTGYSASTIDQIADILNRMVQFLKA